MVSSKKNWRWEELTKESFELAELTKEYELYNRTEGKSPKTICWYNLSLKQFQRFLIESEQSTKLASLEEKQVREFILYLQEKTRWQDHPYVPEQKNGLAAISIQTYVRGLRAFFNWLYRQGYTDEADKLFSIINTDGTDQNYPSILSFHNQLMKMQFRNSSSRKAQYWESLTNRTRKLVRQMGKPYGCSKGFRIDDLLKHSIIWRLLGLSTSLHHFFVDDLLNYAISYRERIGPSELTNVFVIDEAHRVLNIDKNRNDQEEPYMYQLARITRKRGFGLILADQTAFDVPGSAIGNMNTRIVLRLINGPCIKTLGASMSLTKEQMDYLPEMPMRTDIVHSLIYPKPFLIYVPELHFDQRLDEEELKELCSRAASMFTSVPEIVEENNIGTRDNKPASLDSIVD